MNYVDLGACIVKATLFTLIMLELHSHHDSDVFLYLCNLYVF